MSNSGELFHVSLHDDKNETVVLIHGLLASHLEYQYVIPKLADYHILAVDLNGHSASSHILPVAAASCADRVADLIRKHAHGGQAHVVGLSMGGFVALNLGTKYPELAKSLFITGAAPFEGSFKWLAKHPTVIWFIMNTLLQYLPNWLYWKAADMQGMKRHDELLDEMKRNLKWETIRDGYASILEFGWDDVRSVQVKTLAIAAGTADDVEATRKMGVSLPVDGSRAVVVRNAVHAWDLQFPDLFAQGVTSWIRGEDLPKEFEGL